MAASTSNDPRRLRPAILFDRDGVLNVDADFVHRPSEFVWVPGAREAIRHLNRRGVLVLVATNQSGIARGMFTEADVIGLHTWMQTELASTGAWIDDFRFCPHHPEAELAAYRQLCECRKPAPGMIRDLMAAWAVDPARSVLIGDRPRDVAAAEAAGLRGFLYTGRDLLLLVDDILARYMNVQSPGGDIDMMGDPHENPGDHR